MQTKVIQNLTKQQTKQYKSQNSLNQSLSPGKSQKLEKEQFSLEDITNEELQVDKLEDDIKKMIFKPKEINLKGNKAGLNRASDKIDSDSFVGNNQAEIYVKDLNGRTILHRLALEQREHALKEVLQSIKGNADILKQQIEAKDNYGNAPLLLSCVYHANQEMEAQIAQKENNKNKDSLIVSKGNFKHEIVRELLKFGANPSTFNGNTYWTPLHWVSRYGDIKVVNELLNFDAKEYIPDKKGFYPIDYAGIFGHGEVIRCLLKRSIKRMNEFKSQTYNDNVFKPYIDSSGKSGQLVNNIDNPIIFFNPLYHTVMLYWASITNSIELSIIEELLKKFEAYPEGAVAVHQSRTPCHAAALLGDSEKLELLLKDISQRYSKNLRNQEYQENRQIQKNNVCTNFTTRWATLLKLKKFKIISQFYYNEFTFKLKQYQTLYLQDKLKFDFTDRFQNTPLHLASQNGRKQCTYLLIYQYNLSLDVRNIDGWMPKDLTQYKVVKQVYRDYYKYLEKQLCNQSGQIQRQLTSKSTLNKEMIKCVEWMPKVPFVSMKINIKKKGVNNSSYFNVINRLIKSLKDSEFDIKMVPDLSQNMYYLMLQMDQITLEKEAKHIGLKMKLIDINAKQEFEPSIKINYEPFRSKDIQTIIVTTINKLINKEQLQKQGILNSILQIHDYNGIYDIQRTWFKSKRCIPMPLAIINQFFREGQKLQFNELSSIKNYFGEKIGFQFAWMSYFTCWLIIPTLCGITISIYQYITGIDTILTSLYTVIISIWITILMEQWKRKTSEISMKWGVLRLSGENYRDMRPEFQGDETFSDTTNQVDKRSKSIKGKCILLLSLPIMIIMIGAAVVVFIYTKRYIEDQQKLYIDDPNNIALKIIQTGAGIINSIAISMINYLYQLLTVKFVQQENHKYTDSYEASFIYKLFIFKFVNTNISLFYTAFGSNDEKRFSILYTLILGMVIQKSLQTLFFKGPYKMILFWWDKKKYFRQVNKLALKQQEKQSIFLKELNQEDIDQTNKDIKSKMSQFIFNKLQNPSNPSYQRIIFNPNKQWYESEQMLIDTVELNSKMIFITEKDELNEISDVFIMFGLATLFASVCPMISVIVFLHNIIDVNINLKAYMNYHQKPLQKESDGIGQWYYIAQFISISTVVTNSLLLYFTSNDVKKIFVTHWKLDQSNFLWVIIAIEHGILALKLFLTAVINDRPSWVNKSIIKIENEKDQLQIKQATMDEEAKIDQLTQQLSKISNNYNKMKELIKKMKTDLKNKDLIIMQQKDQNLTVQPIEIKEEHTKTQKILLEIENSNKIKNNEQARLVDFLCIKDSEWQSTDRKFEIDKLLTRNLMKRLITETFTHLEKQIINRRISKIYQTKICTQINCIECTDRLATIECIDCKDHFCQQCSDLLHKSSHLYSLHILTNIEILSNPKLSTLQITQRNPSMDLLQTKLLENQEKQNIQQSKTKSIINQVPSWKKFEYFHFAIDPSQDQYENLQKHFIYLKSLYIDSNCITNQDKLDLPSLYVGNQYEALTKVQGQNLKKKHDNIQKILVQGKENIDSNTFNDEDLFYMNRIAFYLFRFKGENVTFANFINRLDMLQNQQFTKALNLWLSLIDENDEDFISKEQFINIIRQSFVQDANFVMNDNDIINIIFGKESLNSCKVNIGNIIKIINENQIVKAFMKCILQNKND